MEKGYKKLTQLLSDHDKWWKKWRGMVTCMAMVVVFITTYALILPAITLEKEEGRPEQGVYLENEERGSTASLSNDGENSQGLSQEESQIDSQELSQENSQENSQEESRETGKDQRAASQNEAHSGTRSGQNTACANGVYSGEGDGYTVYVDLKESMNLPADVTIAVEEIREDEETAAIYRSYITAARRTAAREGQGDLSSVRFFKFALLSGGQEVRFNGDLDLLLVPDQKDLVKNGEETHVLVFKGSTAYMAEDLATEMSGYRVSAYRFFYPSVASNSNWGLLGLTVTGPRADSTEAEASTETSANSEANTETANGTETSTETVSSTEENQAEANNKTATESTEETTEEKGSNGHLAQSLSAKGQDYTIVMTCGEEAAIPADARLQVIEIQKGSEEYEKYLKEASETLEMNKKADPTARFFDIKIMDGDQEIEPKVPVSVQITYDHPMELAESEKVDAVHFGEDKTEVVKDLEVKIDKNDEVKGVSFDADSFSVYGLVTYTVDFHYDVDGKTYDYSITGGGFVSLKQLVEILELADDADKFLADVENVVFSDTELVWVGKAENETTVGELKTDNGLEIKYSAGLTKKQIKDINEQTVCAGDWALISMQPFESEETLTVTMKNGDIFTIKVTDAQITKDYITASGETYTITVIYDETAEIPDGAELSVREICEGTEEYAGYLAESVDELSIEDKDVSFARFFDIEIVRGNEKIEPKSPVQVKIEYKDALNLNGSDVLSVIHFADNGTEIINDVLLSEDSTEIIYEQSSFSVTGTIQTSISGTTANPGQYAVIVTYEGKTYSVDSDGTLTPVILNDDGTVTINKAMIWKYDGSNIYHETDAVDTDANDVASDYYWRYIDANSDNGLFTETTQALSPDTSQDVSTHSTVTTSYDNAKTKDTLYVDSRNKKDDCIIKYTDGFLTNSDGTKYIGIGSVDGVLHLIGTSDSSAAVPVQFATVKIASSGSEVDPWKHTINHIDISIVGETTVSVPLAYGTYTYTDKNGTEHTLNITEDTNTYWTQDIDVTSDDIKNGTLKAYTDYDKDTRTGTEVDNAFYITGYSANAQTANDTAQVRIDGVFKVSMADEFTASDYGYWGFSDATLQKRLDEKVTYTFTTTKSDMENVQVYYTDENGDQYPLYNNHGEALYVSGDIEISAYFDYWDKGDGTDNDPGNTCPPVKAFDGYMWTEAYWQKGGIYADALHSWGESMFVSGMDFRLDGERSSSTMKLNAIEIDKYIVDEEGNLITLEDGTTLTSKFDIYEHTGSEAPTYKDAENLNVGNSVMKGDALMPEDGTYTLPEGVIYQDYGTEPVASFEAVIGEDGKGLVHDHNVSAGMYYIVEDKGTVEDTITAADGSEYVYVKTHIETEYAWRGSDHEASTSYTKPVHYSPNYTKTDSEYKSIPEVLGPYKYANGDSLDEDGNPIHNGFLEFFVYNVYRKVVKGGLKITKNVTYNGAAPTTDEQKSALAGVYTFTIYTDSACTTAYQETEGTDKTISITIGEDGKPQTSEEIELPEGDYWIKENEPDNDTYALSDVVKVTVTAGNTGDNAVIASFTNNINEGEDPTYISVTKTFSGISADQIPDDFSVTVTDGTNIYVLTNNPQDSNITCTQSDDGLTWTWKILNVTPGATYTVSEDNEKISGYNVTTTGTGDSQTVTAADVTYTVDTIETKCSQQDWPVNANTLFAASMTNKTGGKGTLIISKNRLSESERKAVETKLLPLLVEKDSNVWKKPVHYYSVEDNPSGFQINAGVVTYDTDEQKVNLSDTSIWQHVASVGFTKINPTAGDFNITNTYQSKTITINILKVDQENTAKTLTGAKFKLTQIDEDGHAVADGIQKPETEVGENGSLTFDGLVMGRYKLEETESPDGYIMTSYDPVFEVQADVTSGSLKVIFTDTDMVIYNSANQTFTVKNEPGAELPSTGGPGTWIFTIPGSILLLVVGALLWRRRRTT